MCEKVLIPWEVTIAAGKWKLIIVNGLIFMTMDR